MKTILVKVNQLNSTRRAFLKNASASAALLGLGNYAFLGRIPCVSASEAKLDAKLVRLDSGIEPLVRLLEETPREKLLEEVAGRIRKGLSYREVLTALFLAGVRNIRPIYSSTIHAVLVVQAAHQLSLSSPDSDRWLPVFWALDEFKEAQAIDKGFRLEAGTERVPAAHKAREEFLKFAEEGNTAGAEAAVVALVRSAGAGEVFDLFSLYGARKLGKWLGHPAIYVSNCRRLLQTIGWHHAEPVVRSLCRVVIGRQGDSEPDRLLWQSNRDLCAKMPMEWRAGKPSPEATIDLLAVMRQASPAETARKVVDLLKSGIASQSIWDASFLGAAEALMRHPARPDNWSAGIIPLHAATSLNALRHAYAASSQEETCRLLLLQSAADVPVFIAVMKSRFSGQLENGRIDQLEPAPLKSPGNEAAAEIFADAGSDRTMAARKALTYLKNGASAKELMDSARLLAFLKGTDAHDYKFASAVFEDYEQISPVWRDRFLASCLYIFRGSADTDNPLVNRTRAALKV